MKKNLIAAIGMLNMISISIFASPSIQNSIVSGQKISNHQENAGFVPPAAGANEGVFDFKKICDYAIDRGPNKGKIAPIYGLRIKIEEDSAEEVKKMIALTKKEMDAIDRLPKKEKKKRIAECYKKIYKKIYQNPKLVDAMYKQLENDSEIFYNRKNLCDPKCFDRDSESGFITGFYVRGANQNIDPIVLIHGGPGGDAVSMLDVAANLSVQTGRNVLAYTQRGCQRSDDAFDQSSQDLDKVIDVARALSTRDQVALFGHYFGPLIQNYYLSCNDENSKVSASINCAPAPMHLECCIELIIKRKELNIKLENKLYREKNPTIRAYMGSNIALSGFYDWDKARNYAQDISKSKSHALMIKKANYFQESKRMSYLNKCKLETDFIKKIRKDKNYEQSLKKITVPTFIMHGKGDSIPLISSKKLADQIPHSELCVMKDAAHWMYDEKPEKFYPVIQDFLKRVDAGEKIGNKGVDAREKIGTGKVKNLESVGKKRGIQDTNALSS